MGYIQDEDECVIKYKYKVVAEGAHWWAERKGAHGWLRLAWFHTEADAWDYIEEIQL